MQTAPLSVPARPSASGLARTLVEAFAPLVLFYVIEHQYSLRAAIISGVAISVALLGLQLWRDRQMSKLTIFTAASVLIFGALDLTFQTAFFVMLEPAIGNAVWAVFLLASLLGKRNVFAEFAERGLGHPLTPEQEKKLEKFVYIWSAFFLVRAAAFLWMACNLSIDQGMVLRTTLGYASYGVMIGGQVLYIKLKRRAAERRAAANAPAVGA